MMGNELKKRYNQRSRVRGTVERFGKKSGWKGTDTTLLLLDIKDQEGNVLTDHLWFNYTREISRLYCEGKLQVGTIVEFNARVRAYQKGYMGDGREFGKIDYKLKYPRKFTVIGVDGKRPNAGQDLKPPHQIKREQQERALWCKKCTFFKEIGGEQGVGACSCPSIVTWMTGLSFPMREDGERGEKEIRLDVFPVRCHFKEFRCWEPTAKVPLTLQRDAPGQFTLDQFFKGGP